MKPFRPLHELSIRDIFFHEARQRSVRVNITTQHHDSFFSIDPECFHYRKQEVNDVGIGLMRECVHKMQGSVPEKANIKRIISHQYEYPLVTIGAGSLHHIEKQLLLVNEHGIWRELP